MSYEIVMPARPALRPAVAVNEIRVTTGRTPGGGRGNKSRRPFVRLTVGTGVATQLAWRKGREVTIAWGQGPDLGKLRIAPHRDGPVWTVRQRLNGKTVAVTTTAIPEGFPAQGGAAICEYEVLPSGPRDSGPVLIVKLPKAVYARIPGKGDPDGEEDGGA